MLNSIDGKIVLIFSALKKKQHSADWTWSNQCTGSFCIWKNKNI